MTKIIQNIENQCFDSSFVIQNLSLPKTGIEIQISKAKASLADAAWQQIQSFVRKKSQGAEREEKEQNGRDKARKDIVQSCHGTKNLIG